MVPTAGSKCTRRGSRIRRVGKSGRRGALEVRRWGARANPTRWKTWERCLGVRPLWGGNRAPGPSHLRAHGHLTVFVFSHGLIDFDFILFD